MHQTDLTNCDREPIHIPGAVQSHGFLIAVDENFTVQFCSENICEHAGIRAADLLGKDIDLAGAALLNERVQTSGQLKTLIRLNGQHNQRSGLSSVTLNGKSFLVIINRSDKYYLMDFEPEESSLNGDLQQVVGRSLSEILSDKNLQNLLSNAADKVKQIIGYDRVMVYRFHEDGHGEVVAEARNNDLEPWLGLHYPASDIPKQARDLYKKNLVRLIADVNSIPSGILTRLEGSDGTALDLTCSTLRAVSPLHIQYLKNMNVASSFSVSIVDQDNLWGLIACHNYTPRFINYGQRETAKLVGQVLSSAISFRQQEEDQLQTTLHRQAVESITRFLLRNLPVAEALTRQENTLMDAVYSTGAVFYFEKELYTVGQVPDPYFLNKLISWLDKQMPGDGCYQTDKLPADFPEALPYKNVASGLLACRLSRDLNEFMIWFRPEIISTVTWAGNPNKPVEFDEKGFAHISPRQSFKAWSDEVKLTSAPWTRYDQEAAMNLRDEVNFAIVRKATELRVLNEKLREAYAELDAFSYTISHDLKNPLTTIKSFAQLILREQTDLVKIKSFAERIQNGAVKMQNMIEDVLNYSRLGQDKIATKAVNMQRLLDDLRHDLLIAATNPDLRIQIGETPPIQGDEMMVMQVFANLVGNAVKYSSRMADPLVGISGTSTDQEIIYQISDNGIGIDARDHVRIFELFSRAPGGSAFEGSGVGLAIVKRILEKHQGRIWLESSPGMGTTFFVSFKIPELDQTA